MNRRVKRNGREGLRLHGSLPVIGAGCVHGQQGCASLVVFQSIGEILPVRRALQFSFKKYSPLIFVELGWGGFCGKADLPSEALTRRRPWQASLNRNYLPIQSRFRFAREWCYTSFALLRTLGPHRLEKPILRLNGSTSPAFLSWFEEL